MLKRLFKSRKFILALIGALQSGVSVVVDVPPDLWLAIDGLIAVLIGSIAWEDAAAKRSGLHYSQIPESQK